MDGEKRGGWLAAVATAQPNEPGEAAEAGRAKGRSGEEYLDEEIRRAQELRKAARAAKTAPSSSSTYANPDKVALVGSVSYDKDIYDQGDDADNYDTALAAGHDGDEMDTDDVYASKSKGINSYSAPKDIMQDVIGDDPGATADPFEGKSNSRKVIDREDDYRKQRFNRQLSPERVDAFRTNGTGAAGKDGEARSYAEVIRENEIEREHERTLKRVQEKKKEMAAAAAAAGEEPGAGAESSAAKPARKRRWDQGEAEVARPDEKKSEWEEDDAQPQQGSSETAATPRLRASRWDSEVSSDKSESAPAVKKRNRWDETPVAATPVGSGAWDATPRVGLGGAGAAAFGATPSGSKRSRWDEIP
ncbi:hypothetical protein HK405_007072, partial [Cladochytrium tenue]